MASNKAQWLMKDRETMLSVGVMAADWKQLAVSLRSFNPQKQWLHIDIMDGNFVPKITIGDWVCGVLPDGFVIDVHLMTNNPLPLAQKCIDNGAHVVTIQYEACSDLLHVFKCLGEYQCEFSDQVHNVVRGVSLCPNTSIDRIISLLPNVEVIQLLTLDPRDGSKMSNEDFIERLQSLTLLLNQLGMDRLISVDGSMSLVLAQESIKNGANIVVSGSAIFANGAVEQNLIKWSGLL